MKLSMFTSGYHELLENCFQDIVVFSFAYDFI